MNPLPHPVGEKVVCVDAEFLAAVFSHYAVSPRLHEVYTVSELFWAEGPEGPVELCVELTELPQSAGPKVGLPLRKFRLLTDVKTLRSWQRRSAQAAP
jgi:hypothetical protein